MIISTSFNALFPRCVEGVSTYPGHENNTVDTHLPFLAQHLLCFLPENPSTGGFLAGLFGVEKLLGLGKTDSNETNTY
jgi:hypothetical protein